MSEVMRVNIIDIDLSKPLRPEHGGMLIATYDTGANAIGVNVFRDGKAAKLSGCTATGYFLKPDGKTIKLNGTVSGNTAYVVMQRACYKQTGRFRLAVTISDGLIQHTVRIVNGFVQQTITNEDLWKDVHINKAKQSNLNEVTLGWIPGIVADWYMVYEVVDDEYQFVDLALEPYIIIDGVTVGAHEYAVQPVLSGEQGNYSKTTVNVVADFVPDPEEPDEPDVPVIPDEPSDVSFTVDSSGAATLSGASLTVDANGNGTLTGATLTVDTSGAAKVA